MQLDVDFAGSNLAHSLELSGTRVVWAINIGALLLEELTSPGRCGLVVVVVHFSVLLVVAAEAASEAAEEVELNAEQKIALTNMQIMKEFW